ncbi:matrixin family metalloprotease [Streptosporangium sp. OZ121]|uniref:matrixin family metalloprotease n=1 Tax=Streptosporangium sp. OZ121 TaxID=3444183 RepID=UPI003F7A165E
MKATVAAVLMIGVLSGCVVTTQVPGTPPSAEESGGGHNRKEGAKDGYSFLHTRDDGEPVRWSTCEPISYVVRTKGRPEGGDRLLRESLGRISEATGLKFSYRGSTDETPGDGRKAYQPDRYGDRWAPVLIAYSGPEESARLRGQAVGYGGPVYVRAGRGVPRYVSGTVVFDAGQMTSMGGDDAIRAVMLHELAHLVGLGHVDDPRQLMNPVQYGRRVTTLQEGDLAGLKAVGDGQCYKRVKPRDIGR